VPKLRNDSLLDWQGMIELPSHPYFPSAPEAVNSGVDFLALGAVGERLVAYALPGITNVTRFLRPYSVASWVAWQFNEQLKDLSGQRLPKTEKAMFKQFREKVELLFSWANSGVVGSIGSRRTYPSHFKPVEMRFDNRAFGAVNRASWFAPATYGPSFAEGGLGFIAPHKGAYIPTDLGRQMAQALDALLAEHPASYSRIRSIADVELSRRDVEALFVGLTLQEATAKEKKLFRGVFYQEGLVGNMDGEHGNRSSTLALILRSLDAAGSLDEHGVRQTIALGLTPDEKAVSLVRLEPVQKLWFALGVRQLQRVALERLLRWFEKTLDENALGWCDLRLVQDRVVEELLAENPDAARTTVSEHIQQLDSLLTKHGGPVRAMLREPTLNAFSLRTEFEAQTRQDHRSIPARALYCLLYCSLVTRKMAEDGEYARHFKMGGRERISLDWFARYVDERKTYSLTNLAREVIQTLVYAQHLQVAATRVEEGKNKFRFAMDDTGLRLLIDQRSISNQLGTPDRIESALRLMSECGLASQPGEQYFGPAY
jgi:hypothetical protein